MEFNIFYEMGHSWLEAKLSQMFDMGLADRITSQSRIKGKRVFLDVDFDAREYLKILRRKYPKTKFSIKKIEHSFDRISEMERYSRESAKRMLEIFL